MVFILALPIKPGFVRRISISRTSILFKGADDEILFFVTETDLEVRCNNNGVKGSSKNCSMECIKLFLLGPTTFGAGEAMVISSKNGVVIKGGLISLGIYTLVPLPKKWCQIPSLSRKVKFSAQNSCCFSTDTLQGDECSRTCLCQSHQLWKKEWML